MRMQAQGCEAASLAEDAAMPLMQCPLLVRTQICNLVNGADDSWPTLRELHHGIFNECHQMGCPVYRPSKGWRVHTHTH